MDVIVVGQCKRIVEGEAIFIFKGFWHAHRIRQINVESNYTWERGEDYVLHLFVKRVELEVMSARLKRARKL